MITINSGISMTLPFQCPAGWFLKRASVGGAGTDAMMFFIKSDERSRTQTASPGRSSVPSEEDRPVGHMLPCTSDIEISGLTGEE